MNDRKTEFQAAVAALRAQAQKEPHKLRRPFVRAVLLGLQILREQGDPDVPSSALAVRALRGNCHLREWRKDAWRWLRRARTGADFIRPGRAQDRDRRDCAVFFRGEFDFLVGRNPSLWGPMLREWNPRLRARMVTLAVVISMVLGRRADGLGRWKKVLGLGR